jgi:F-type H+-transporting ATPase subunit alpha
VKDFQNKLVDYLSTRQGELLKKLREKGAIDDEISKGLKEAVGHFAETYTA